MYASAYVLPHDHPELVHCDEAILVRIPRVEDILQVGGGAEDRIVQREFDELSHVDQTLRAHTSMAARQSVGGARRVGAVVCSSHG